MSPMSPTAPANRRYALRTGARSPFRRRRGGRAFIVWRFLTGRWTGLSARWNAALRLGGGLPFAQADSLLLPKQYEKTVAAKDNRGNDIRPSSVVRQDWTTHTVADSTGMYGALLFPLSAGENRLTLTFSTGTVAVSALRFYNVPDPVPLYRLPGEIRRCGGNRRLRQTDRGGGRRRTLQLGHQPQYGSQRAGGVSQRSRSPQG